MTAGSENGAAPRRRFSLLAVADEFFFVFAGIAAIWLAWLLLSESFHLGWWGILVFVVFWGMLAYLVLPGSTACSRRSTCPTTSSAGRGRATACWATP
ncbi:hypothetical protein AB3K78_14245 [Leucobacter sp. HNU]|uniref:hypothetical protein n=1 Tax=Leucobacter sp. HNU TaxID=3236805 RepID=UPI003A80E740